MKKALRNLVMVLAATLFVLTPASAKYVSYFGFAGDESAETNPNVVLQGGFDVIFAPNHLFEYRSTATNPNFRDGRVQEITITRSGYYAFVLRGGDGGTGRDGGSSATASRRNAFGGTGGMAMGYVWVDANTKLYVVVSSSGYGSPTNSDANMYPYYGAGLGHGRGGGGGGSTILSTASTIPTSPSSSIIAVAGGGGGGGGYRNGNNSQKGAHVTSLNYGDYNASTMGSGNGMDFLQSCGGDAGASGNVAGNAVLNGYQANTTTHEAAGGIIAGTYVYNTGGVYGLVSTGYQAGTPAQIIGAPAYVQKSTAAPATSGTSDCSNSPNAGGGGGVTKAGDGGTGSKGFLKGGDGWDTWAGGGGGGWYGGAGGDDKSDTEKGGGGGGSSFIKSTVKPLTAKMLAHDLFKDFTTPRTSFLTRYGAESICSHVDNNCYYVGHNPNSTQTNTINAASVSGQICIASHITIAELGNISATNDRLTNNYYASGLRGFAYIVYLGPQDPAEAGFTSYGLHNY